MALINCPVCGKAVSEAAAACPNCGHPISNAPTVQVQTQQVNAQNAAKPKKKHTGLTILLVILGVFVLLFGGCVALGAFGKNLTYPELTSNNVMMTLKNGTAVTTSVDQLIKESNDNEAAFKNKYEGAEIAFVSTVRDIEGSHYENHQYVNGQTTTQKTVHIAGTLKLANSVNVDVSEDLAASVSKGDKVQVSGVFNDIVAGEVTFIGDVDVRRA